MLYLSGVLFLQKYTCNIKPSSTMSLLTPTVAYHHDVYEAIKPSNSSLSVAGKTVLITGGGQGIGVAFAEAFSLAGAANIVLLGRKLTTLNSTKTDLEKSSTNKAKIYTFEADITNQAQTNEVFDKVGSTIGKIDIYIANAGYLPSPAPVAVADLKEFETAMAINVTGSLIAVQAFLRNKAEKSTLISINTGIATLYYVGPVSGYVASKAASARLMDQVAAEHTDVRVFNMHPGLVATAMSAKASMEAMAVDTPELPAAFAVWLASPEADFLRGRFVWSSWDVEELKQMHKNGEFERNESLFQFNLVGWPFQHKTKAPWDQ